MANSTGIGYKGNTMCSLKYILYTRNYRTVWPHNNIMGSADSEQTLLSGILKQQVGVDLNIVHGTNTLGTLSNILEVLLRRHNRINYEQILQKIMSKHPGMDKPFTDSSTTDRIVGCPIKLEHIKDINFLSTKRCVSRLVIKRLLRHVVYTVLPFNFFGIQRNRRQFLKTVIKICSLGKGQVFALKNLLDGISTKGIPFLKSIANNLQRTNLLAKTYLWLVRCYIFGLFKCLFYVTESVQSNQLLFFEKSVWQSIDDHYFSKLRNRKLAIVANADVKPVKAILRVLPKKSGLRAIVLRKNCRKFKSRDEKLVATFLQHIIKNRPSLNLSSSSDFYVKWLKFYQRWIAAGKPIVHFARVDFYDTFGSVNQNKLVEIIERACTDVFGKGGSVKLSVNSICYTDRPKVLLSRIEYYVKNYVFKNNKYSYKIIEGIPQGGQYSASLCNLYLNDIDSNYLQEFSSDEDGLLIRFCDDYFYASFHSDKAVRFLETMENGFPDYGLSINKSKTRTNISDSYMKTTCFNIYDINLETLQIHGCYHCYQTGSLFHRMLLKHIKQPGKLLKSRVSIMRAFRLRKDYFNLEYNTQETVIENLHHVTVLLALKFCSIVKHLFTHYNRRFLKRCVSALVNEIVTVIINMEFMAKQKIDEYTMKWVIINGFDITLQSRKKSIPPNMTILEYFRYEKLCAENSIEDKEQLNFIKSDRFRTIPVVFQTVF